MSAPPRPQQRFHILPSSDLAAIEVEPACSTEEEEQASRRVGGGGLAAPGRGAVCTTRTPYPPEDDHLFRRPGQDPCKVLSPAQPCRPPPRPTLSTTGASRGLGQPTAFVAPESESPEFGAPVHPGEFGAPPEVAESRSLPRSGSSAILEFAPTSVSRPSNLPAEYTRPAARSNLCPAHSPPRPPLLPAPPPTGAAWPSGRGA